MRVCCEVSLFDVLYYQCCLSPGQLYIYLSVVYTPDKNLVNQNRGHNDFLNFANKLLHILEQVKKGKGLNEYLFHQRCLSFFHGQ